MNSSQLSVFVAATRTDDMARAASSRTAGRPGVNSAEPHRSGSPDDTCAVCGSRLGGQPLARLRGLSVHASCAAYRRRVQTRSLVADR